MKKTILVFAAVIVAVLSLLQLSKYNVLVGNLSLEIFIAIVAAVFFVSGLLLTQKTTSANNTTSEINTKQLASIGLTQREYQVLCEIANGLSNQEIAQKLHLSESTIKTHVSNIYSKLYVKRRTQAIQKAKALKIIAS